jgi:hypothetical protein
MTIRTALLEARYILGDQQLFAEMRDRFDNEIVKNTGAEFVAAKLAERDQRIQRAGTSRYLVEPNVKEGKGGLRDLNTLFWIAKYVYRVRDLDQLVEAGLFSAAGSISRARQWTPSDRERSALLADTVHSGRPLVSTSTRRHLFANLSMPVCAVKNSMRFKTQSILPYSMVLVRTSHLTLHRTQPPSIASQTTVLSRGSSGGYSCCTPVLLISRLLKYRLHHSSVAVRIP